MDFWQSSLLWITRFFGRLQSPWQVRKIGQQLCYWTTLPDNASFISTEWWRIGTISKLAMIMPWQITCGNEWKKQIDTEMVKLATGNWMVGTCSSLAAELDAQYALHIPAFLRDNVLSCNDLYLVITWSNCCCWEQGSRFCFQIQGDFRGVNSQYSRIGLVRVLLKNGPQALLWFCSRCVANDR